MATVDVRYWYIALLNPASYNEEDNLWVVSANLNEYVAIYAWAHNTDDEGKDIPLYPPHDLAFTSSDPVNFPVEPYTESGRPENQPVVARVRIGQLNTEFNISAHTNESGWGVSHPYGWSPEGDFGINIIATGTPPPPPPSGLSGTAPSVLDGNGTINGTTTGMEYSTSQSGPWADCGDGTTALPAGTYYVRYKASGNTQASNPVAVTIPAYLSPPPPCIPRNTIYGVPIYGIPIWAGIFNISPTGNIPYEEDIIIPDHYEIEFYDREGVLYRRLVSGTGDTPVIKWDFELTTNGCGRFSLTLERGHDIEIEYGQRVDIKLLGTRHAWYSGYIQTKPVEGTTAPEMEYSGYGFFNMLDTLVINGTYENMDITEVVRRIVLDYVDGRVPISLGEVYDVGYVVNKIHFDYLTVKEALKQLSDFAVNFIYGVDEQRSVFFKPVDDSINEKSRLWVGHHITSFLPEEDVNTVVNKIIVLDKDTIVKATVHDDESINTYGLHEKAMTLPNTESEVDAVRWGNSQLEKLKTPKKTAKVKLNSTKEIIGRKIKAERCAMITSIDGTIEKTYPIKKVKYSGSGNGIIMTMELGEYSKDISEYMLKLERQIKNVEMMRKSSSNNTSNS